MPVYGSKRVMCTCSKCGLSEEEAAKKFKIKQNKEICQESLLWSIPSQGIRYCYKSFKRNESMIDTIRIVLKKNITYLCPDCWIKLNEEVKRYFMIKNQK